MKTSQPYSASSGGPGMDLNSTNLGQTASPEKLAAAKAIAAGEDRPVSAPDPQVDRLNIKKIVMKTNASTNRDDAILADPEPNSTISDDVGTTNAVTEDTKPLSPQFAALAKQRRALQVKERELAQREAQLKTSSVPNADEYIAKADLLANPLKIFEAGLTYDQLTEAILANQSGINPEIQALKAEIKALKDGVDKNFVDRDASAEQQVLAEMRRQAEGLAKEGDDYEMVRETKSIPEVMDLIYRTYKSTGEVLDVPEALRLVEDELINESLKIANIKKVRSQLKPSETSVPLQKSPQDRQMRTLTNRDTARVPLSRKERAIAAMMGTLKK